MKAVLKALHSLELEDDLLNFWPKDPSSFGTWIRLAIGPDDEDGSEFFDIFLCTPDWLKTECAAQKYVWGRHTLFTDEYDFVQIKAEIVRLIEKCAGEKWTEIAISIAKFTAWEYEDYAGKD